MRSLEEETADNLKFIRHREADKVHSLEQAVRFWYDKKKATKEVIEALKQELAAKEAELKEETENIALIQSKLMLQHNRISAIDTTIKMLELRE